MNRIVIHAAALILSAASLSLGLVGCEDDENPSPYEDAGKKYSEAEIAGILNAANTGEVQEANVASPKATNAQVKAFASRMISEHTATLNREQALFAQLGITPAESDKSNELKANSQALISTLNALTGEAFDKKYIDAQVTEHAELLGLIDNSLLPSAQSAALKTELQTVRAAVASHLQEAQSIQAALASDAGTDAGTDAEADAGDAETDAGDAEADGGTDAEADAGDAEADGGPDAEADGGDAETDAGDAEADGGTDAEADGGDAEADGGDAETDAGEDGSSQTGDAEPDVVLSDALDDITLELDGSGDGESDASDDGSAGD